MEIWCARQKNHVHVGLNRCVWLKRTQWLLHLLCDWWALYGKPLNSFHLQVTQTNVVGNECLISSAILILHTIVNRLICFYMLCVYLVVSTFWNLFQWNWFATSLSCHYNASNTTGSVHEEDSQNNWCGMKNKSLTPLLLWMWIECRIQNKTCTADYAHNIQTRHKYTWLWWKDKFPLCLCLCFCCWCYFFFFFFVIVYNFILINSM